MIDDGSLWVEAAYQRREGSKRTCGICPQQCILQEGEVGKCGGRQVVNGHLWAVNYGQLCTLNLDPIERKPLYHFFPGGEILSVGPNGCNLSCKWCQNHRISQCTAPTRTVTPRDLADMVDALDGIGVAYTYAEPLIWFEFVRDAGHLFHERELLNVFVTNGFINREPLLELIAVADAFNIDLKSLDDHCYRHFCGGRLSDVQRSIRMVHDAGKHLEITHLVVTGVNDDLRKIEAVVDWVASLDTSIPLHLTRYFPTDSFPTPPTDIEFLHQAYELARAKLDWVYLGNLWTGRGVDSYCPSCSELLVRRSGGEVELVGLDGNRCLNCGRELNFRLGGV